MVFLKTLNWEKVKIGHIWPKRPAKSFIFLEASNVLWTLITTHDGRFK